jgi:hypothetical protein
MSMGMWQPDRTGRPQGAKFVACVSAAAASVLLLATAGVLLAVGHAGGTLALLPAVLVLAGYATYVLESSARRHRVLDPACVLENTH